MLPAFILGLTLMIGLILVSRWVAQANPRQLLRLIGWTTGGVVASTFVFLAVTGRLAWALAALAALLPWLARLAGNAALSNLLRGALRGTAASGGGAATGGFGPVGGAAGWRRQGWGRADDRSGRSEVTTRFLRMTLDHATGTMDGLVLEGDSAGRALADLDGAALAALWRETGADPDSQKVLEAWLDRARPHWRETFADAGADAERTWAGEASRPPPPGATTMDRAEALALLGLEEGADTEAIRAAWRRLIQGVHPDRGGSPYLAARLNQARDLLLGSGGRRQK